MRADFATRIGDHVAQAATLAIFSSFVSSFIHTNVRINLGPLRYIFISPPLPLSKSGTAFSRQSSESEPNTTNATAS